MKHRLHRLIAWWFAIMVPVSVPPTTIQQRETLRKRRLFSMLMLLDLLIIVFPSFVPILVQAKGIDPGPALASDVSIVLALWINQRGYLKCASLVYLLTTFLTTAAAMSNLSLSIPLFSFSVWALLPILSVVSALFLPAWGPLLLGGISILYTGWFVFIERHVQIAMYLKAPADQTLFFLLACVAIIMTATFSAISTAVAQRAVVLADRTVEVEQAHQELSVLHADLTDTYSSLEAAHATIQMQALTDGLTNLPNHRAVMEQFTKEIDRARRHQFPFSILFFDADHFKRVNDTYGHGAGDAVLCEIGERASRCLRSGDTLGRFGGEEFVILLFDAEASGASIVAERIRAAVAAEPMALSEVAGGIAMTVSIGRATYLEDGQSEQELLAQADQAMYVAKRMGRNQVRGAAEARQISADPAQSASWDEQTRIETMQREGLTPEQIQHTDAFAPSRVK